MPAVQACPGCGREYTHPGRLCPCGYAERAVRFAERDTAPPAGYLEWHARERERRADYERARAQVQAENDRRMREQLAQDARDRAAQEERNRRARERRAQARRAQAEPKPKPYEPPEERLHPLDAHERRRSFHRIALTNMLGAESAFLEQRSNAAHEYFLKILERAAPPEEISGWREPAEIPGRRYNNGRRTVNP